MCVDRHGEAVTFCNFANESKVTTFIEVNFMKCVPCFVLFQNWYLLSKVGINLCKF